LHLLMHLLMKRSAVICSLYFAMITLVSGYY
jgi:hypothetical protein